MATNNVGTKSNGSFRSLNNTHILLNLRKNLPAGYILKSKKSLGQIFDLIETPTDLIHIYVDDNDVYTASISNIFEQDKQDQPVEADDEIYKLAQLLNNDEILLEFHNSRR
ncbi:hypothetical protein [Acinetobacter proteolyticus]|uniref:hypothetical protein n=1 Tax=Acinetobacter proteolyticus TaxID=1776741 RepID=UPI0031D0948A